jgi:transposase InsO family protein
VLAAHPGQSQGRPKTTSSSQLIVSSGLPCHAPPKSPETRKTQPKPRSGRRSRDDISYPDNGAAYIAIAHAIACRRLGIKHLRTRPYRPQTNGKAERFIRTLLAGWAYGFIYGSSRERTAALDGWLWHYNHRRRHSALGHQPPVTRTNLLGSYT